MQRHRLVQLLTFLSVFSRCLLQTVTQVFCHVQTYCPPLVLFFSFFFLSILFIFLCPVGQKYWETSWVCDGVSVESSSVRSEVRGQDQWISLYVSFLVIPLNPLQWISIRRVQTQLPENRKSLWPGLGASAGEKVTSTSPCHGVWATTSFCVTVCDKLAFPRWPRRVTLKISLWPLL